MKNIPIKYLIWGGALVTVVALVASAMVGPKLISEITVGFGGEGSKRYCTDGYDTGLEFAPNMFHAESNESYTQWKPSIFADGKNMQAAPKGTVPRNSWYVKEDYKPYALPDSPEGYEASATLKSPITELLAGMDSLKRADAGKPFETKGKKIYETFCMVCHGETGDGQGNIVKSGKYPTPSSYSSKVGLTEGQMFHSVTYGKNLMGSYASQVTPEERWAVIYYIKKNFLKQ